VSPQQRAQIQVRIAQSAAVNSTPTAVNKPKLAVNTKATAVNKPAVNKRGVYPNTDARRTYMRDLMRKRRCMIRAT
jgi:hypothetical protein